MLNKLEAVATKVGCSLAQLSLAWVIVCKDVSTCIIGASKTSQLEENLKALLIKEKLTPEILSEIEAILGNKPEQETNYRIFKAYPNRR